MKVATVSIAGERRVGRVTGDGRSLAPFDLPLAEAQDGVLALVRRDGRSLLDIPTIIEKLSAGVTLQPGDVIATGTPAGVGIGFSPARYLKNGDVVRIEIGGIGVLENEIVERSA
jgi:2-keto-4-pentenoate hydratase/2-oxohepta-3-ene-1,7-dioic acid hydratase in catechol pathway